MKRNDERYALISVYDKTGIVALAKYLHDLNYKIISTGGTAKVLTENNIPVIPIQNITGNPESFDGRMKTISFQIESGILFDRQNPTHIKEAHTLHIKPIDIVVCNLYPFEETIKNSHTSLETAIENIDVGGSTMLRAAAKNFQNVLVVTDPKDYKSLKSALKQKGITQKFRKELAAKAFALISFYDSQIAAYLNTDLFPGTLTLPSRKLLDLRYGENPHQLASVYQRPNTKSFLNALKKNGGRDLSLINVTDINAGLESVRLFSEPAAVVIKHNTPCGIALGKTLQEALKRAIEADPQSAFGGVIVLNKPLDLKTAKVIASFKTEKKGNIDIIASPSMTDDALELLKKTRKNMGLYSFGKIHPVPSTMNMKWVDGGFIMQTADCDIEDGFKDWKCVTKAKPTKKQLAMMRIGWKFISRMKSNTIVVMDKNIPMTRGIGCGQTSRVGAAHIALNQSEKFAKGAILVSDSFFPFDDSVKLAAKYKIAAIVQQGGSVNDRASIDAANRSSIPMVFTGRRAFWH